MGFGLDYSYARWQLGGRTVSHIIVRSGEREIRAKLGKMRLGNGRFIIGLSSAMTVDFPEISVSTRVCMYKYITFFIENNKTIKE